MAPYSLFHHILQHFISDICCLDSINLLYADIIIINIYIIRSAHFSSPAGQRTITSTDTYQNIKHISDRDISNQSDTD